MRRASSLILLSCPQKASPLYVLVAGGFFSSTCMPHTGSLIILVSYYLQTRAAEPWFRQPGIPWHTLTACAGTLLDWRVAVQYGIEFFRGRRRIHLAGQNLTLGRLA